MAGDFELKIEFDAQQYKEVERMIRQHPKRMPQIVAEGLNRAANTMAREVARGIAKRYALQQSEVRPHIKVEKAIAKRLSASVRVKDSKKKAWHVYDFKVTPRELGARLRKGGLKVGVLRGGTKSLKHAFVTQMKSGHIGVFEKTGEKRRPPIKNSDKKMVTPIRELMSPSPGVMAAQSVIREEVERKGHETFEKRIQHGLDLLSKVRGVGH